jgi:hypothetical protein
MFEVLFIALTFIAFGISFNRAGFLPFPTGLILIFAVSQVMLLLVHDDVVDYGMHDLYDFGGERENYTAVQILYTSAALMALLTLTGKFKVLRTLNLSAGLASLLKAKNSSRYLSSLLMILLCGLHLLVLLLLFDWSKLWLHQQYLQPLLDDRWMALLGDEVSDTVSRTSPLFAILSTFCVCRLIGTRYRGLMIIAGAMSLFYFLLQLSLHSRAAAFVPALFAVNFTILGLKGRRIIVPVMLVVAVISLMGALEGRETDRHGFSTLLETIASPFMSTDPFRPISEALMDFCQGTVVTAESFSLPADFDLQYKILVFSPLPSLIDGYSSVRPTSEHRLHLFVPMSGVGELYHFGWLYICVLLFGFTVFIRAHTAIADKIPAIFIICNFLIMFSIYLLFSYPVRNALRYYWIAVFVFAGVSFALRRWSKGKRVLGVARN